MNKELTTINIDDIKILKTIRNDMGDLDSLEQSIRNIGILNPLIIDKNNALIAGSRRLQAAKNVGLGQISVFKVHIDSSSMEALDIQADENLCRLDLSPEDIEKHISSKVKTGSRSSPIRKAMIWLIKLFS